MSRILIKDGSELIANLLVAESTGARMRGLLGRTALARDTALLIRPCRSIHMWFMRFPIDAVFLDENLRVLKIYRKLRPWQLAFAPRGTTSVLETAEDVMDAVSIGDILTVD